MANSGYSGTPLHKKLGITREMKIRLIGMPEDYFTLLNTDISGQVVKNGSADFIHLFVKTRQELETAFPKLIGELPPSAIIWISWYKKAARIPTDITEDGIREIVLPTGWVDVKVCAVSDIWSGLKIVKRKVNR